MGDIIKMILALTVISALAGMAIGTANDKTKDRIAEQLEQAKQAAVEAVFPEGVEIKEMNDKGDGVVPNRYWVGFEDGKIIGYAFKISGKGYAGDINYMIGVDVEGKILGISVLDHNETPGLGSRVNEVASTKYIWNPLGEDENVKPWFTEQFEGLSSQKPISIDKSSGEWHKLDERTKSSLKDKNAVTAITGSTISTTAFTRSIEQTIAPYLKKLGGYCCPATKKNAEAMDNVEVDVDKDLLL